MWLVLGLHRRCDGSSCSIHRLHGRHELLKQAQEGTRRGDAATATAVVATAIGSVCKVVGNHALECRRRTLQSALPYRQLLLLLLQLLLLLLLLLAMAWRRGRGGGAALNLNTGSVRDSRTTRVLLRHLCACFSQRLQTLRRPPQLPHQPKQTRPTRW